MTIRRRLNFTGRVRIPRRLVDIRIIAANEGRRFTFSADLAELALPPDAFVYVEAYRRSSYMRFRFGTVASITAPRATLLSDVEHGDVVLFRVKIVDPAASRIVAEADRILPRNLEPENQVSILPVDFTELGSRVWKIDWEVDHPILVVNELIPDARQLVRGDPTFHSLVFPEVVRQVLEYLFVMKEEDETSGPARDWLRFVRSFHPDPLPTESEDLQDWIDGVVASFCAHHGFLRSYVEVLSGEQS